MLKKEKVSSEDKATRRKLRALENEKLVLESWQKSSELGKMKFAFKFGTFTWGLPTFVIYSILMMALNLIIEDSVKYNISQAILSLIFFIVFGMLYGMTLWNKNEKIYRNKFPYGKKTSTPSASKKS